MFVADIMHVGDLMRLHPDDLVAAGKLSAKIQSARCMFLVNDDMTAYVNYDFIQEGKWVGHIQSLSEARGAELWMFAAETAKWMVRNMGLEHLLCFVKEDNQRLQRFVRFYKMDLVGTVGEDLLYSISRKKILNWKGGKLCHH